MKIIKEMIEDHNTEKRAKKYERSFQKQKYRDNLAKELKRLRKKGDKGRELAKTLLESEKGSFDYFYSSRLRLRGIDVAESLIKYNEDGCRIVACNLRRFRGLLSKEIAETLIDNGFGYMVASNLSKFEGLDTETAEKLVEHREGYFVLINIDKFEGLDGKKIAKKIINGFKKSRDKHWVLEQIYRLPGLDEEIAQELTEIGYGDVVEKYPEKFGLKK